MSVEAFTFGSFRLIPAQKVLLENGRPLPLGARALEILRILVESAGTTVSKQDLLKRAWPGIVVDEAALRVHISALRKALGHDHPSGRLIFNSPGQGYAFVAPVVKIVTELAPATPGAPAAGGNLPALVSRVIGRDDTVAELTEALARTRVLSIIGSGGVGKTTVATAVAAASSALFADGTWFVGLASLAQPELVATAVSTALDITVAGGDPQAVLCAWLARKRLLLLLDNCEHLIEAVALLSEHIVRSAPGVTLLTTSREPLRIEAETRYRLAPLALPIAGALGDAEAKGSAAVMLFAERASAASEAFRITNSDVPTVVEICRQLDGIPLAIELAAAYVGVLGLNGLAKQLRTRSALMIRGRRTAFARQRTLNATLDWSYELLSDREQALLRRLAVFQGKFTIDAVLVITRDWATHSDEDLTQFADLVDKSLVSADISGDVTQYYLLELTRAYALDLLSRSGEHAQAMGSMATFLIGLLTEAAAPRSTHPRHTKLAACRQYIDSIRAALTWSFSDEVNTEVAIDLAVASTDLWFAMSLLSECCDWGLQARVRVGGVKGTKKEMVLLCGLGQAFTYSRGMDQEVQAVLSRAVALSEKHSDVEYQCRSLYALWLYHLRVTDLPDALTRAQRLASVAASAGDRDLIATANVMFGVTNFYLGEHIHASEHLVTARAGVGTDLRVDDLIRYGAYLTSSSFAYSSVTSWTLGFAERAMELYRCGVAVARKTANPASVCIALNMPSAVFLIRLGELDEAERCIEELLDHSATNFLHPYHAVGQCSKGVLAAERGDLIAAERDLRAGLQRCNELSYHLFSANFRGELALVLCSLGRLEEALAEIDEAIRAGEATHSLWCMPELCRIKGQVLAATGDASQSEQHLVDACQRAAAQRALAWELRAVLSLSETWIKQDKIARARSLLADVVDRFVEGHDSADMRRALQLQAELG